MHGDRAGGGLVVGHTHLYFVRHGRTQWNAEGRVQGGGNLDEVGLAQVCALARRLASHQFEAVYASPLPRTRQTAAIVAGALGLPVRLHFLLRDLDYGETAGMLATELRAQYPDLWERLRTAPQTVEFPGGESLGALRRRMERFMREAAMRHSGDVLAVTHDSPVRVVASIAKGLGDVEHGRPELATGLASLTVATWADGAVSLEVHGDVAHLQEVDALA